jgi:mono/diheme cytochrome c family protein
MNRVSNVLAVNERPARGLKTVLVSLVALGAVAVSSGALAQGAPQFSPGALVWADGGCATCHGGIGQGGTAGEAPPGPNLWRTRLNRDQIKEAIACGRENTQMPFHLKGAFTQRACWGKPVGNLPDNAMGAAELSEEQIDTLVAFLVDNVVGKEPVTKAKCAAFFGNNTSNPACARYP